MDSMKEGDSTNRPLLELRLLESEDLCLHKINSWKSVLQGWKLHTKTDDEGKTVPKDEAD